MKKEWRSTINYTNRTMVNIDLHRSSLILILREIYSDSLLRNVLGFKGGTAAMLFYGLSRLSVDLDFDLLDLQKQEQVFKRLQNILPKFGKVSDQQDKRYTLFFLINYEKGERNVKIEISKRSSLAKYQPMDYLGIFMLVMRKEDMTGSKLAALLTRNRFASRDLFDLWFFLKNEWQINENLVSERTGFLLPDAIKQAQKKISEVKNTQLISGLGELLDNKQKAWVKDKLKEELLFLLKLYEEHI